MRLLGRAPLLRSDSKEEREDLLRLRQLNINLGTRKPMLHTWSWYCIHIYIHIYVAFIIKMNAEHLINFD